MTKPVAIRRRVNTGAEHLWPDSVHPLLARVFANRGLGPWDASCDRLANLIPPSAIGGMERACQVLAEAIDRQQRICIVGDFDADGATGTAVGVRGLRMLGAIDVCYRVPNRFRDGYGLSVGVVESLAGMAPDLIVTVDNGIASHAGVAAARARGIRIIVTDHHLPGATLPDADAIVNPLVTPGSCPHESGSGGPSPHSSTASYGEVRNLAGVGVVFYLLLALRMRLYPRDRPDRDARPDLATLLDLVALGTVADLVPLDANNRILVSAGLNRIRAGCSCAGIAALYAAAGRDPVRAVASDLGFALGPRINAAGRLDDMSLGIECLLSDDPGQATALATRLSEINHERRDLQATMVDQAEATITEFIDRHLGEELPHGIVLHQPSWHAGVVGLVASKLKERLHRPVVAFARVDDDIPGQRNHSLRGSGRSIAGFHLRDALAEIDVRCPGLVERFGGHAMAAGLTIAAGNLEHFSAEFDAVAQRRIDTSLIEQFVWSDGALDPEDFTQEAACALRYAGPWGQAFSEPAFDNEFDVESWRAVGERHMRLILRLNGCDAPLEGIMFNALEFMPPPTRLRALYQLDLNEWNGNERLQLLVRHIEQV